jgi:hypothetical protein
MTPSIIAISLATFSTESLSITKNYTSSKLTLDDYAEFVLLTVHNTLPNDVHPIDTQHSNKNTISI